MQRYQDIASAQSTDGVVRVAVPGGGWDVYSRSDAIPSGLFGEASSIELQRTPSSADFPRASQIVQPGVADSAGRINSALSGYGGVLLDGVFNTSNIVVPSGGVLAGFGKKLAKLRQISGSSGPAVSTSTNTSNQVSISGFTLDGNKAGQTEDNVGLHIDNSGSPAAHASADTVYSLQDPRNDVRDLLIINTKGVGLRQSGKGASDFSCIWVYGSGGRGIEVLGFDSTYTRIDVGNTGGDGIYLGPNCANNRFLGVKAWWTGGAGISIDGSNTCEIVGCEVQAPALQAMVVKNANHLRASSINLRMPTRNNSQQNGLEIIDTTMSDFIGVGVTNYGGVGSLLNGVLLSKQISGCVGVSIKARVNYVSGVFFAMTGGQSIASNDVCINSEYEYRETLDLGYTRSLRLGALEKFASDPAAAASGIPIGGCYINSASGSINVRLS